MKIRSITCFAPQRGPGLETVAEAGRFLQLARRRFEAEGFEVQSVRLALPPVGALLGPDAPADRLQDLAHRLEREGEEAQVGYLSLGPLGAGDPPAWVEATPSVLHATERVFLTLQMADPASRRIDFAQVRAAARCIVDNAPLRPDGFVNLRFAALANVRAGVPFLPAAYSDGTEWSYAVATESADLARTAFDGDDDLATASAELVAAIDAQSERLERAVASLESERVPYRGADFSLATFPRPEDSIGAALESMGGGHAGAPGSTFRAAVLTSCVDRASHRRAGFNGLFLPVLEDDRLALRAGEGALRLEDLMLASTVCGTGLDTVPLPGDVEPAELEPWLLDLCALALRLDKPLTARLMPMPGRQAGDEIAFDFPYFASGRVLDLPRGAKGLPRAKGSLEVVSYRGRSAPR